MGQTDGQTDGSRHRLMPPYGWSIITARCKMSDERFASDRSIFSEALTFVELSRVTIADGCRYLIINLPPQQVPERPSGASRMQ